MGRPRQKNKDLPVGLYRDAKGRITLKVFTEEHRRKLGGKSSMSFRRDIVAARVKWAEVYGFRELEPAARGTVSELIDHFLTNELSRVVQKRGDAPQSRYSARTRREYRRQCESTLRPRFGAMKYAASEAEAARGDFIRTMHVQTFLREGEATRASAANHDVAVLSSIFSTAKRDGFTEYNPCLGVQRHQSAPRESMPDDALFLELYAEADAFLQCWMDIGHMVGSRVSDILRIMESDWSPDAGLKAIPAKVKRGQARAKQLFRATPDLTETVERMRALKRAEMARWARRKGRQAMASVYLLPNPTTGEPYTLSGFESKFRRAKERLARKRLGAAADTDQVAAYIRSLDYHFHDHRARAADDAEKRGEKVADFLAHATDATSRRHYLNRSVKVLTPNPKIRRDAA